MNEYSKGYEASIDDTYSMIYETVEEWYALKIVDDKQYIALKELCHELEKRFYYVRR